MNIKSHSFKSLKEFEGEFFLSHQPPKKAGPKIHGSIAKLNFLDLKTKQEWFRKKTSISIESANWVNFGFFSFKLNLIFSWFNSYLISFFLTLALI